MLSKNNNLKKYLRYVFNILFFSFLFLFIISPGIKGFVLRQLISAGLYKVTMQKAGTSQSFPGVISFAFTDSQNKTINLSTLKGKVLLINFWATWCPPCRAEMPSLNNLYVEFKNDKRFEFVFINEDDVKAKAAEFLRNNYPAIPLYTSSGEIPVQLFNGTLPTTIVINKEGKIVWRHEGMGDYDTGEFIKELKALL